MAQSLSTKIRKLSEQFNIDAIISTAQQVKFQIEDEADWNKLTVEEKTAWFFRQCEKYGLTTTQYTNQIKVDQLPEIGDHGGSKAYFTVFLPRKEKIGSHELSSWKLEIGGAYVKDNNGGIWITSRGLRGKELQIAQVMRLHGEGQ